MNTSNLLLRNKNLYTLIGLLILSNFIFTLINGEVFNP